MSGAFEQVERVVNAGGDADDILRRVVTILHEQLDRYVRIRFVEEGRLVAGPTAGEQSAGEQVDTTAFPISFQGRHVADLEAGADLSSEDSALLERIAAILSPYALVGWDTGGEEWAP
jgi:predicted heme/steroid binding protein